MEQQTDKAGAEDSTAQGLEAPMETQTIQETGRETSTAASNTSCAHQRLIDDVLTRGGKRSGKVRCLECGAVFDDPYRGVN